MHPFFYLSFREEDMKKIFCAFCFIFASCGQFEALEIISFSPSNEEYGVSTEASVRIEFSADVKKELVESSFVLNADNSPVPGSHSWESGRIYRFIPHRHFAQSTRCVMELPKSIEDIRGNSMEKDFIAEFYVGNDLVPPSVLSSIPEYAEGGTIGVSADIPEIEILFSEAMDTTSASSAFSISPDIAGYIIWRDENTRLVYHLQETLEHGKQYCVTISSSAKDAAGNALAKNFTLVFIVGDDFTHPEIRGTYESGTIPPPYFDRETINRGISRFSSISIEFSEPMNKSSVESAFSLTPASGGRFEWSAGNTVLTFIPDTPFSMDTVYTLSIAESAKDSAELSLRENYSTLFRTDAADSLPFFVSHIEGTSDIEHTPFETLYDGTILPWPLLIDMGEYAPPENGNDYMMKVYFANAEGPVAVDIYSLIESLLIEGDGSPCVTDIAQESDGVLILFDGLVNIRNPETPTPNLYRFTIAGGSSGVKDAHGNTMTKSFMCEFKDYQTP